MQSSFNSNFVRSVKPVRVPTEAQALKAKRDIEKREKMATRKQAAFNATLQNQFYSEHV